MDLRAPPNQAIVTTAAPRGALALSLLTLVASVAGFAWLGLRDSSAPASPPELTREVAAKLKAAGALEQAGVLYGEYVRDPRVDEATRARVAFSVGQLYLERGQAEQALRWYYEAESLNADAVGPGLAEKIVHALERLGRVHAAQAALASRVGLSNDPKRAASDPVVARIGADEFHRSDILRALDDLPPQLRQAFDDDERRGEFLRRFVADELVWRKAQKLEYQRDPDIQRQLAAVRKQLVVSRFIEREVLSKIQVTDADLETFYKANLERYRRTEEGKQPVQRPFAEVRSAVDRDYRRMQAEAAYRSMVDEQLSAADVELFVERMTSTP